MDVKDKYVENETVGAGQAIIFCVHSRYRNMLYAKLHPKKLYHNEEYDSPDEAEAEKKKEPAELARGEEIEKVHMRLVPVPPKVKRRRANVEL